MWLFRSLPLTTSSWWEEKKGAHQLFGLKMAHTTYVHILLAGHMALLNHRGNGVMYSCCVPRKKMKQIYGEQLAVSVTHPVNRMKLNSGEAEMIFPLWLRYLKSLSNV